VSGGNTQRREQILAAPAGSGLLGLPDDALTMALIPLGYPAQGRWAEPKRRPVDQVVHWNSWGATRPRAAAGEGS